MINPAIKNITVSGRMGTGQTTLAKGIAKTLGWKFWEGGAIVENLYKKLGASEVNTDLRPDDHELWMDNKIKEMLKDGSKQVVQSNLAGFMAQGIPGVFKILVTCEEDGEDKVDIRIDRLVNRKGISVEEAKEEVKKREQGNLAKWRRLYADNDQNWVYWEPKYYDLVINTFDHNAEESLKIALQALEVKK
jgi:cytidylate kinase